MSRIANIKDLVGSLPTTRNIDDLKRSAFKRGLTKAAKLGFAVHTDGRCYVPESKRGRGVGYGRHGHG